MPRSLERRFPLHVHISLLFTLLLLTSGVILGVFNYRQATQIILSSSDALFGKISQQVEADLEGTYRPIDTLLNLMALTPGSAQDPAWQRQERLLRPFVQALRDHPKLAALYQGYDDGDFLMVRPLRTEALKKRFDAPPGAAFQVWSIERNNLSRAQSESLFLDDGLTVISRRQDLNERYDPRSRPWFNTALEQGGHIATAPYVFFSSGAVGTTLALPAGEDSVIGADLTLDDLSATLAAHRVTPGTQVVLFAPSGEAVAYPDSTRLITRIDDKPRLTMARDLDPAIAALLDRSEQDDLRTTLKLAGRQWVVSRQHLQAGGPKGLYLALLAPEDELLADAYRIRWQGGVLTLVILILCIPVGWLLSRILVKPLRALVVEAEAIRRFDFDVPALGRSPVLEVDQLAVAMEKMKVTLGSFLDITATLSAEKRFDALLSRVLDETVEISESAGGILYLLDAEQGRLEPQALFLDGQQRQPSELGLAARDMNDPALPAWIRQPANGGATLAQSLGYDQAGELGPLLNALGTPRAHLMGTGLHNRQGDTIGLLVLLQRDTGGEANPAMLRPERIAFVEALSGVAALCIESQRLLERQKQLLDAFIQLIAGAIDAKSPYTGGHCQRVPEITLALARAAAESDDGPFRDYNPSDEDWEALHIAAWLHDCGKVTTPNTWWTRPPSWKPSTTASMKCGCASRCSSAMPGSPTGGPVPKEPMRPCWRRSGTRCWPPWMTNSPSSPAATWAGSSWPRWTSSGCRPLPGAPGCAPWTTAWACPGKRPSARPVRRPAPCQRRSRCWRTAPSTCWNAPRASAWRRTIRGDSVSTCRNTSSTGANCTTSPSHAGR